MKFSLPQYNGKDYLVLTIVIVPFTLAVNSIIFGSRYFTTGVIFFPATFITAFLLAIEFFCCGLLALALKKRLPHEEQTPLRLFLMILFFVGLSGVFLLTVFHGYEAFPSFNYSYSEKRFIWAYVSMAIINIFLTLLM